MRIKDLSEGFADGFKQGYGKPLISPRDKPTSSAINSIPGNELKKILAAILKGQQLDSRQLAQLKQIYNKL